MNKKNKKKLALYIYFLFNFLILSFIFDFISNNVFAQTELKINNNVYNINIDKNTIIKGATVNAFNNKIKLSLTPGTLSEATDVQINLLDENIEVPWQLDKISQFYQFEFKNKTSYDNARPFYIQLSYDKADNNLKQVFYYNKITDTWRPLPTKDFPKEKFVRSLIHLPYARIAVFSYPNILTSGIASWYNYKKGFYSASPDFPKGSRLRVYNTKNNKFVDVVINDYGPNRSLHPDRVLDLEKTAFSKIAAPSDGGANILVEPLFIPGDKSGTVMGIPKNGASQKLNINMKSFAVMDESSGNIIFSKNSTSTLPLASLTKLIAVNVFLETKPTLNRVVAYSIQDEKYNYEYCSPGESARLKVKDGETMTIEDLIYSSLVGSANNSIESLVRVSGLVRSDFINKMNEMVLKWGASSTNFIEPTGLSPKNVSSSFDYAIITKEVFKNPIIEKSTKINSYIFSTKNTNIKHTIKNTNYLVLQNKFNIIGSKTGYLDEAGYCLMTRVKSPQGKNLIVVTFGAENRDQSFNETEKLITYGLRKI